MAYVSYLERNLQALEKVDPFLVAKLRNHTLDKANYLLNETNTPGMFNLAFPKRKMLYYDQRNPLLSAKNDVDATDLKNPKMVLFLGFGLGYHLAKLCDHKNFHKVKKIYVIEKDLNVLLRGLSTADITKIIETYPHLITFFAGVEEADLYAVVHNHFTANYGAKFFAGALSVIPCGGALGHDRSYYISSLKSFNNAMFHSITDHGNSPEDSLQGLENTLENLDHIITHPGLDRLEDIFRDKPAIIVASGPSLNKNIEQLKNVGDKALIMACDASLGSLLKQGIKPHVVSSMERTLPLIELYEGLEPYKDDMKDTYFCNMPIVRREIIDKATVDYGMKQFVAFRNYLHFRWLKIQRSEVVFGKSVAHLMYKIAVAMGCNPIILVGQDLAYGDNGETHEAGATAASGQLAEEFKTPNIKEHFAYKDIWVKGNYQEKIRTCGWWQFFRKTYEEYLRDFRGTVINATEGGAYIEGTEVMTLKDALAKSLREDLNIHETIDKHLSTFSPEKMISELYTVKDVLEETLDYLDHVVDKCQEGVDIVNEFKEGLEEKTGGEAIPFSDVDTDWIHGFSERINDLKKDIVGEELFRMFMMHNVQAYLIKKEIDINSLDGIYNHINEVRAGYIVLMLGWFEEMAAMCRISRKYLERGHEIVLNLEEKVGGKSEQSTEGEVNA